MGIWSELEHSVKELLPSLLPSEFYRCISKKMFTDEFLGSSIQTGEVGTSEVGQLLAGKRLRILKNQVILKKGAFNGTVVRGFWKETEKSQAKEVAVKRIKKIDCHLNWKTVINNKKLINHYNVLKVLDSDEDQSWRLENIPMCYYLHLMDLKINCFVQIFRSWIVRCHIGAILQWAVQGANAIWRSSPLPNC